MDISADLHELARCPVGLVSAGVKSILDIERSALSPLPLHGKLTLHWLQDSRISCKHPSTQNNNWHLMSLCRKLSEFLFYHMDQRTTFQLFSAHEVDSRFVSCPVHLPPIFSVCRRLGELMTHKPQLRFYV